MQNQGRQQISSAQFAAKYRSKREVYTFLAVDFGAYLPDYKCLSIYFLKDLLSGSKTCKYYISLPFLNNVPFVFKDLKSSDAKHLSVPYYQGLTVGNITQFLSNYPEVFRYFPEHNEVPKLPRQWIINVAASVIHNEFGAWVKAQLNQRNARIVSDKNLMIDLDPDIAEAFQASTAVSMNKGQAANMLRVGSKRRKVDRDHVDANHPQEQMEQELAQRLQMIIEREQRLNERENDNRNNESAANIVREMIQEGIAEVDDNGQVQIPGLASQLGSKVSRIS